MTIFSKISVVRYVMVNLTDSFSPKKVVFPWWLQSWLIASSSCLRRYPISGMKWQSLPERILKTEIPITYDLLAYTWLQLFQQNKYLKLKCYYKFYLDLLFNFFKVNCETHQKERSRSSQTWFSIMMICLCYEDEVAFIKAHLFGKMMLFTGKSSYNKVATLL